MMRHEANNALLPDYKIPLCF